MNEPVFLVGKHYAFQETVFSLRDALSNIQLVKEEHAHFFQDMERRYQNLSIRIADQVPTVFVSDEAPLDPPIDSIGSTEYVFERRRICIDVWECVRKHR